MDSKVKDILEGLKIALEAEMTGYHFYRNAAKNTADPLGKETFSHMAQEEMNHFNDLKDQYKAVMEKGGYDFSKKRAGTQKKHAESPIFSAAIKARIKDSHFEVSALSIGMKLEMDAMNYYSSCAEKAADEAARKFYSDLAEWEKDHYLAFKRQLEILKEEYFQANNFIPT